MGALRAFMVGRGIRPAGRDNARRVTSLKRRLGRCGGIDGAKAGGGFVVLTGCAPAGISAGPRSSTCPGIPGTADTPGDLAHYRGASMKTSLSRASLFAFVLATGLSGCFGGGNDSSSDCPIDVVNFSPASGKVGALVTITGAGEADDRVRPA